MAAFLLLYELLMIMSLCTYPLLSTYTSDFTGDASSPMRTFERRRVGVRKAKATTQKPSSQPSASKKRKCKEPRPNYHTMDSVEYARVRHKDWYTQNERDTDIEDSRFWCLE